MEEEDTFKVTIRYEREGAVPDANLSNEEKVLMLIRDNPKITAKEMSAILDCSVRIVMSVLSALKEKNIIERIGSDKSGKWLVKGIAL